MAELRLTGARAEVQRGAPPLEFPLAELSAVSTAALMQAALECRGEDDLLRLVHERSG